MNKSQDLCFSFFNQETLSEKKQLETLFSSSTFKEIFARKKKLQKKAPPSDTSFLLF